MKLTTTFTIQVDDACLIRLAKSEDGKVHIVVEAEGAKLGESFEDPGDFKRMTDMLT